jgi:type II secretory ATPase GspE/PulE/Tfp pilus assembly ATPase PilB-like protein
MFPARPRIAARHYSGDRATGAQNLDALHRPQRDQRFRRKIITIEDPVEYQLKGVNQIQVSEKAGLTFARGCAPFSATTRM